MDYLGKAGTTLGNKDVAKLVRTYFGELSVLDKKCSIEETIERVQAAYARIQFAQRTPKEKYSFIQSHNKELNIMSKNAYEESKANHPRFIENPKEYFNDYWISWYHFLGIDTSRFPYTKADWIRVCKDRDIHSWTQYKSLQCEDLPKNPGEMYPEYTNWDSEFEIEEEDVW